VAELGRDGFSTTPYDSRADLARAVERGYVAVGVALPENLAATLAGGADATVEYLSDRPLEEAAIESVVRQAVAAATLDEAAIRFAVERGASRAVAEAALRMAAPQVPTIVVVADTAGEAVFAGAA